MIVRNGFITRVAAAYLLRSLEVKAGQLYRIRTAVSAGVT
jgi:hypothetical protein